MPPRFLKRVSARQDRTRVKPCVFGRLTFDQQSTIPLKTSFSVSCWHGLCSSKQPCSASLSAGHNPAHQSRSNGYASAAFNRLRWTPMAVAAIAGRTRWTGSLISSLPSNAREGSNLDFRLRSGNSDSRPAFNVSSPTQRPMKFRFMPVRRPLIFRLVLKCAVRGGRKNAVFREA